MTIGAVVTRGNVGAGIDNREVGGGLFNFAALIFEVNAATIELVEAEFDEAVVTEFVAPIFAILS